MEYMYVKAKDTSEKIKEETLVHLRKDNLSVQADLLQVLLCSPMVMTLVIAL